MSQITRQWSREFSDLIRGLHEEHGVVFHLEETATAIEGRNVKLKGGTTLSADLVVVGIGVRPRTQLAERAGLGDHVVRHDQFDRQPAPGEVAETRGTL